MAKTIKFNLICDGKPIRTIEELRNNFSIEDILTYFNNHLLQKWLEVRGYLQELEAVNEIEEDDNMATIKQLIKIFNVEKEESIIEESIYILSYKAEYKELLSVYEKNNFQKEKILNDYHTGYHKLLLNIVNHNSDIAKIKAAVKEIDEVYHDLFDLDYRNLFYTLLKEAPMAILAMLMRNNMRNKYLPLYTKTYSILCSDCCETQILDIENPLVTCSSCGAKLDNEYTVNVTVDINENLDKKEIYNEISKLTSLEKLTEILGDTLCTFSGVTDGYWKDVEDKGKNYLILNMDSGNYIRGTGIKDGDLSADDIKNKFIILDGIDYKSNNSNHTLAYMEV